MSKQSTTNHVCTDAKWSDDYWPAFLAHWRKYEMGTRWLITNADSDQVQWVAIEVGDE
jgi:hypothetical protein